MTPNIQIARKTPLLPQEMKTKKRAKTKPPRTGVEGKENEIENQNQNQNQNEVIYDPNSMHVEVEAGVNLILRFVQTSQFSKNSNNNNTQTALQVFKEKLVKEITSVYTGHWYPDMPLKGSAFRCLRINDNGNGSLIEKTAKACSCEWIVQSLPREFTIWIDPSEVSYRIGEEGSICVHYVKKTNTKKNSTYTLSHC